MRWGGHGLTNSGYNCRVVSRPGLVLVSARQALAKPRWRIGSRERSGAQRSAGMRSRKAGPRPVPDSCRHQPLRGLAELRIVHCVVADELAFQRVLRRGLDNPARRAHAGRRSSTLRPSRAKWLIDARHAHAAAA